MWKKISLILVLTILIGFLGEASFGKCGKDSFTGQAYAAEDGTITYSIDATTEITYKPRDGEFGTVYYRKKHFTGGSVIRYYTSKFVITMDEKSKSDNLELETNVEAGGTTVVLDVSDTGEKQYESTVDKRSSFYWYDTEIPDDKGYITTTYVIDGSYFHKIMENASTQGRNGEMYIHHVFAITGDENNEFYSWNHIKANAPFYTYDRLFSVKGWNNNEATYESQDRCRNVPVPYIRNIPVYTTYFDDEGYTVKVEKNICGLSEVWNKMTEAEITDAAGRTYRVVAGNRFGKVKYVWFKKEKASDRERADFLNREMKEIHLLLAADTSLPYAYGSLEPLGKEKNINRDSASPGVFAENGRNTISFDLNNLGDKKTAWAIQLYIPVSGKTSGTNLNIHFFDSTTKKAVGISKNLGRGLETGTSFLAKSVDGMVEAADLGDEYFFDETSIDMAFYSYSDDAAIVYDYDEAEKTWQKGEWKGKDYYIPELKDSRYNVIWVPVRKEEKQKKTTVYVKYCVLGNNGKMEQISEPIGAGYAGFGELKNVNIEDTIVWEGNTYKVTNLLQILYGNSKEKLVNEKSEDCMNFTLDGSLVIGSLEGKMTAGGVSFTTASEGDYHVVFIECRRMTSSSRLTIHYIDAFSGEEIRKTVDDGYLLFADEVWDGINGQLEMTLSVPVEDSVFKDGMEYVPVYRCEDSSIVMETKHNQACTKGETVYQYTDGGKICSVSFCNECGICRREESVSGNKVHDNGSYADQAHNYTTYIYNTPYKTKYEMFAYLPGAAEAITSFDGSHLYGSISEKRDFKYSAIQHSLVIKTTDEYAYRPLFKDISPYETYPKKKTGYTAMSVYIPCVVVENKKGVSAEVRYITLKDNGKKDREILVIDDGGIKDGRKYEFRGSSIIEKDNRTYVVTGEGASVSYDDASYWKGKNDRAKGTPAEYDGIDHWITKDSISGVSSVTLYIPVREVKYEVESIIPRENVKISRSVSGAMATVKAKKGTPFDVMKAIPSSEFIYAEISAKSYLFSADFKNVTGMLEREVSVELPYILYTKDDAGNIIDELTKQGKKSRTVTVSVPYAYWTLDSYTLYKAEKGIVTNGSADIAMEAVFNPEIPSLNCVPGNKKSEHVRFIEAVPEKMTMPTVVVYGTKKSPPKAPQFMEEYAQTYAAGQLPDIEVRNDSVVFGEIELLEDSWHVPGVNSEDEKIAVGVPEADIVSAESGDVQIPAEKSNAGYASSGRISYVLVSAKKSGSGTIIHGTDGDNADAENDVNGGDATEISKSIFVDISDINSVQVHTPVVANLTLVNDNLKYVQAMSADAGKVNLVVGRSEQADSNGYENCSNDFKVQVSNNGNHIDAPGYGKMDTSKYVLNREIMFSFDVFRDRGSDRKENDDILIKAGNWTDFDENDTWYLPEWVIEGSYTAKVRTTAINGAGLERSDKDKAEQKNANLNNLKYVAYDEVEVVVSGKLYGLTITSVNSEHAEWKNVFIRTGRIKNAYPESFITDGTLAEKKEFNPDFRYYYTSGLNNELGIPMKSRNSRYIFPVLNGSSPVTKGTGLLKSGYTWNFKLCTAGSRTAAEKSAVVIIPSFYRISADGTSRERVDVWYSDNVEGTKYNYIKIGDKIDALNVHTDYAASETSGIPQNELTFKMSVLKNTQGSSNAKEDSGNIKEKITKNVNVYTYGEIINSGYLKTFTGLAYADRLVAGKVIREKDRDKTAVYEQTWYFEYALPDSWHACDYGYDVNAYLKKNGACTYNEDFWKKDGYLVVHFDIGVYDEKGLIMTYANSTENQLSGMCNMWAMEGYVSDRTDAKGNSFRFVDGDVFMVGIGKNTTAAEDYITDHLN